VTSITYKATVKKDTKAYFVVHVLKIMLKTIGELAHLALIRRNRKTLEKMSGDSSNYNSTFILFNGLL